MVSIYFIPNPVNVYPMFDGHLYTECNYRLSFDGDTFGPCKMSETRMMRVVDGRVWLGSAGDAIAPVNVPENIICIQE